MANHIQMVMYEGYLTADPEMRFTPGGKEVTNFVIGSSRSYKLASGETAKETTWLKVTTWGKLANIVNDYCEKGSHVIVRGTLRADESGHPHVYQLKDGSWGASYEITASDVRIIKGKANGTVEERAAEDTSDLDTGEIPF